MADLGSYKNLEFAFAAPLSDLSDSWAGRDIAYVRDLAAHAEYGEALENLVALGAQNGKAFSPGQLRQIERMASMMKMDGAALLAAAQPRGSQFAAKLG